MRFRRRIRTGLATASLWLASAFPALAAERHAVHGMVLQVDLDKHSITVSCDAIPGYMDAMVMPFTVRDVSVLKTLQPGKSVSFSMVEDGPREYAEQLQLIDTTNYEAEPTEAARLAFLRSQLDPVAAARAVPIGQPVPDFTLNDQLGKPASLSGFQGKVVAITFAYSRCPNPNYCFRLSNNLARLRRRFKDRAGRDLVLITIVIDPANDQGKALEQYAATWKADPAEWHFLTGPVAQIRQIAESFGMNFWGDEGFLIHSFHTVVIDRQGRMAANLDGNNFSADQLGDLVQTVLNEK